MSKNGVKYGNTKSNGGSLATHCDRVKYVEMYRHSLKSNEAFWAEQAQRLDWMKPFTKVKNCSFKKPVRIRWFEDGILNASVNCVDRHLNDHADSVALICEPDDPNEPVRYVTYLQLYQKVNRLANALKRLGVKKGDRVTIYMPMIPEAVFAMLACARIGAIHCVVFGGFSSEALADRIRDCGSEVVITADEGFRAGKKVPIKENVDAALKNCPEVRHTIVVKRSGGRVPFDAKRDIWYEDAIRRESPECDPEPMNAEDPLFILYTSGSTNKPKGVLHTTGGYLLYAAFTHEYVFDYRPGEIFFCTADVGWITGHSYIVYGPLANAASVVLFEGVPNYPTASRLWEIVDRHQVDVLYTAPTAIRSLMRQGDEAVLKTSRASLRLLGTVGEPINPEAWQWYHRVVGGGRCPIVDTWWQTETGGILISPLPAAIRPKPGSATLPFFGIQPEIVDDQGRVLSGETSGNLVIADSWPGQARSIYRDHARFEQTYFSTFEGKYFTGDGCRRDGDGYYWITGRVDDVLNVSGHRLGTAEIESAIMLNPHISEAAVVGFPHDLKGQGIFAFAVLHEGISAGPGLLDEIKRQVRAEIGPIASPDRVLIVGHLPKTRSGKIMRRILRKLAEGEFENIGDTSTLLDPSVVERLAQDLVAAFGHPVKKAS